MLRTHGLEYQAHGEGEPMLLIHGSHVADSFLQLTRKDVLAHRYRLIRYHRRGFAGSDPHAGPFSIDEQARDALALLQGLGVQPAHVIGHSYRAVTAPQLACEAPSAVHSLVLLEPPKTTAERGSPDMFAPLIANYRSGDARGTVDSFMAVVGGSDWRAEVQRTVPGGPEQAERDAATFFDVELPALRAWIPSQEKARGISQPVLYILGGESGPHFDRPNRVFQSIVTHTEEVLLPGMNHLWIMRNPEIVAKPIADSLTRHPL